MSDVEGKVVVITGASGGVAAATARLLARRGAKLVLGGHDAERMEALAAELRREGHPADFRQTDVIRIEEVRYLVQYAAARHGRIDVLVNSSGMACSSPITELDVDEWNRSIDVNLRGTLHGIAAVLPHFRQQGSGHIVNICSPAPADSPIAAVYNGTQFAIRGISESLRHEVGSNIRVSLIDATELDLADRAPESVGRSSNSDALSRAIASAIAGPYELDLTKVAVQAGMIDIYRVC